MHAVRRTSPRAVAAALSSLVVLLSAACSPPTSSTGTKGYISGSGAITVFAAADRKPAPSLHGTDLDGQRITVGPGKRFTVVNIWASWCAPCRAEAADLVEAARRLPGVQFYGVDIRDVRSAASAYVRTFHVPYPSLFDPESRSLLTLHDLVSIQSPPTTLVIDDRGRLAAVISGELTASTLVGLVHDLSRAT